MAAVARGSTAPSHCMERIAASLERLAPVSQAAPNYQKTLEEFRSFDWAMIGATIVQSDPSGAAIVEWNGQQFTRRSPTNKFGEAIWFSRSVGKDDDGNTRYERLITFKKAGEVEPIPDRVNRAISHL
ncbi:single-stranded DNA-binding protein [Leptolyngbya sp. Cla-17]|uniref:single-stranded DNA-binding protein n=1 Tax=Leptolyngbya sp. Cla-17 TaxID=2803751 RepID=UPI001490BA31|nr:single-stranded DNA-binding protein [Leptolyngbya sp. Cla-17]